MNYRYYYRTLNNLYFITDSTYFFQLFLQLKLFLFGYQTWSEKDKQKF